MNSNTPVEPPGYAAYMRSSEWHAKRVKALTADKNRCRACGSVTKLHVHHMSYDNLGNEPLSDLVTLCQSCHSEVHNYHKVSGTDLKSATLKAITWIQSGTQMPTPKNKPRFSKRTVWSGGTFRPACLGRKDRCDMPAMNGTPYCYNHDPQFGPPVSPPRKSRRRSRR